MGDGTEQNPYTREDVLRLIEENGGTAKELDLSGKWFEVGIDLKGTILASAHLEKANLVSAHLEEADLRDAHLEGAYLADAHLEGACLLGAHLKKVCLFGSHLEKAILASVHLEGVDLVSAHLEGAYLASAHLEGANLVHAHLEGAYLAGVKVSAETNLENVNWGDYILGEERDGQLDWAEDTYRTLKVWHTQAGIYDIAGEFFFKEMATQRKQIKWWPQPRQWKRIGWWLHPRHRLWSWVHSFTSGYGERPLKVVRFGALVLLVSTLMYFLLRGVAPYDLSVQTFLNSLYYSAVSFTALGYGPWFSNTSVQSWVQGAGAVEAFFGVFTIALFLVTFTRKMRR